MPWLRGISDNHVSVDFGRSQSLGGRAFRMLQRLAERVVSTCVEQDQLKFACAAEGPDNVVNGYCLVFDVRFVFQLCIDRKEIIGPVYFYSVPRIKEDRDVRTCHSGLKLLNSTRHLIDVQIEIVLDFIEISRLQLLLQQLNVIAGVLERRAG